MLPPGKPRAQATKERSPGFFFAPKKSALSA
jgi:hypothetical protein